MIHESAASSSCKKESSMFLKILFSGALGAFGLVALVGLHLTPQDCPLARLLSTTCVSAVAAADVPGEKPALSGKWGKKMGELTIEFAEGDVLKIAPHG